MSSLFSGDGHAEAAGLDLDCRPAESASDDAADASEADLLARQLDEARVLLREASHLCRYHHPGLHREIAAFLASVETG